MSIRASRFLTQRVARGAGLVRPRMGLGVSRPMSTATDAPAFNWEDPLAVKAFLTEEEVAISETAERYCQEQLLPRVLRS